MDEQKIKLILAKVQLLALKAQNGGYDFYAQLPKGDQEEVEKMLKAIDEELVLLTPTPSNN